MKNNMLITIRMKRYSLLLCLLVNTVYAQPNWSWAKKAGGKGVDVVSSIASDKWGYVYVTGGVSTLVTDSVKFDNYSLTGTGAYLAKYNSSGNVVWAKNFSEGTGAAISQALYCDQSGNIIVVGFFQYGTVIFGADTFASNGKQGFIAKYDTSGTILWARKIGANYLNGCSMQGVKADLSDNIYISGYFIDTVRLGNYTLVGQNLDKDILIGKYNSSGNVIWAKKIGGKYEDQGFGIDVDNHNDIYATGFFKDTIAFGSQQLISSSTNIYLTKMDSSGNFIWSIAPTHTRMTSSAALGMSVSTDTLGKVYVAGTFNDSMSFDSNILPFTSTTHGQNFLAQYNGNNGQNQWVKNIGGIGYDIVPVVANEEGNVYVGAYNTFGIAKYNNTGTLIWQTAPYNLSVLHETAICLSPNGYVYSTGYFNNTATFGSTILTSSGDNDVFIVKLPPFSTSVPKMHNNDDENNITVSPNPTINTLSIDFGHEQYKEIRLYDQLGRVVIIQSISSQNNIQTINIGDLVSGLYYLQVSGNINNQPKVKKVLIEH